MSWPYHPDLLARPVPRYTSYPTAAEFHDGIGAEAQAAGLAGVGPDEAISLYLHIPYCRDICWYCGCNTGRANRAQRLEAYLTALHAEIELAASALGGRGRVVRVAFGGGSPNAIAPAQFDALEGHVRDAFAVGGAAIWSIEVDPRGFDEAFAAAIARAGIARASLGVQTFDDAIQARIGRVQPTAMIETTTRLLRAAGVGSINHDLMYGLPGQDLDSLLDGLGEATRLGADRLAVFGYAHVPHLIPRQTRIDASALPGAEARFAMAAAAHGWLVAQGWQAIGFDHFAIAGDPMAAAARAGRVRRNFQGFTDDPCETMIGLGASSISRFAGAFVQNEKAAGRYGLLVKNGRLPGVRGIARDEAERARGAAIEALLCRGAADLGALGGRALAPRFADAEGLGLVSWAGETLCLAPGALPYARTLAARLDPWRETAVRSFSSAV